METLELLLEDLQSIQAKPYHFGKINEIRNENKFSFVGKFDPIKNMQSHIDNITSGDAGDHVFESHDNWPKAK
jgi:hypothetical protein